MKTTLSCTNCMAEIMFTMQESAENLTTGQIRDLFSCQTWWINHYNVQTCAVVISQHAVNVVTEDVFFNQAELYAHCTAIFILKRSESGLICTITRIK